MMKECISTDLAKTSSISYFLWDEPLTVAELKGKLNSTFVEELNRLLGKISREAREREILEIYHAA